MTIRPYALRILILVMICDIFRAVFSQVDVSNYSGPHPRTSTLQQHKNDKRHEYLVDGNIGRNIIHLGEFNFNQALNSTDLYAGINLPYFERHADSSLHKTKRAKIINSNHNYRSFPIVSNQSPNFKTPILAESMSVRYRTATRQDLEKRSLVMSDTNLTHDRPMIRVMLDYPDIKFWKRMSELTGKDFIQKVGIKALAKSRYSNVQMRSYQSLKESKELKAEFRSHKTNLTNEREPLLKLPKIHDTELILSEHASCKPRTACVEIDDSVLKNRIKKHGTMYYPACIEIDRCSGCCLHTCLRCDPISVSPRKYTIMEIDVSFNEYGPVLKYSRSLSIVLDNHDKCECQCNMGIENCRMTYCI